MKYNKLHLNLIACSVIFAMSTESLANTDYVQGTVLSDKVFYQIGGGSAVMPAPSRKRPNEYSIGFGWKSNLMCGNFDIKTSIKNQLNGITEGFKDLYSNVIQSATGAVASLPAMIIQRANPQLYDLLSNGLYQAKLDFDSLKTSCEDMSNMLADYAMDSKWAKMAGLENYKNITANEVDPKVAQKKMEKDQGKKGITWIGGDKKGGENQESIDLIKDVVSAGFNMSLNRDPKETGTVAKSSCDGMLCTEWQSPDQMAEYARKILGETTITTCDTCGEPKKTQAGMGLAPEIEEQTRIKANLLESVLNSSSIAPEQLNEISTSTIAVTRGLIEALREDPDAAILGARLAQELAISKELEKVLVLRRVLLTGMREPNVAYNNDAQTELEKSLKMLDREIEQVRLEMELQRSISNNTAIVILNNRINDNMRSLDSNVHDNSRRLSQLSQNGVRNTDNSLGGISGFPNSLSNAYIAIPISDGTGLGNIYGSYSTSSSSTSFSSSSVSYSQIGAISGTALEQTAGLLRQFEGFRSNAYEDVNAYRVGYGSDTVTRADGTIVKVTKNTVVTREDAERDLARRSQEFANVVKREISESAWNALPANAQAALTSYAYNYGSLSKTQSVIKAAQSAATTGNMNILADAIRNRQVDNDGLNARRRNQEADYIANSQQN